MKLPVVTITRNEKISPNKVVISMTNDTVFDLDPNRSETPGLIHADLRQQVYKEILDGKIRPQGDPAMFLERLYQILTRKYRTMVVMDKILIEPGHTLTVETTLVISHGGYSIEYKATVTVNEESPIPR